MQSSSSLPLCRSILLFRISRRLQSSLFKVPNLPWKEKEKKPSKKKDFLSERPHTVYNHPLGIWYPNEKGLFNYDPDVPLKELIKKLPEYYKSTKEKLRQEILDLPKREGSWLEKIEMEKHEVRVDFRFDTEEELKKWSTGADSDWDEGYSHCELVPTQNHTALFRGRIDSRIPKNGVTERAGWASFKYCDLNAFERKKFLKRWMNFTHVIVKCRGDGRTYKLNLHTPMHYDVTWGNIWSYPLHTHGGPYWQIHKIPFSRVILNVYGRIQDRQMLGIYPDIISSVSIALMDRVDGDFNFEIDWIGAYGDHSHLEKHAYEYYYSPLINPLGV